MYHAFFDSKNDVRIHIIVNYFPFTSELVLKGKKVIFSALCEDYEKSISQEESWYCNKGAVWQKESFKIDLFKIRKSSSQFSSSEGLKSDIFL